MSGDQTRADVATERVIAIIDDDELARRYPNGTHFVEASNPEHGVMATRALFEGDPVALIYPDGHEILLTPERVGGLAALILLLVSFVLSHGSKRNDGEVIQLPPRTRIEARDSAGMPIAA